MRFQPKPTRQLKTATWGRRVVSKSLKRKTQSLTAASRSFLPRAGGEGLVASHRSRGQGLLPPHFESREKQGGTSSPPPLWAGKGPDSSQRKHGRWGGACSPKGILGDWAGPDRLTLVRCSSPGITWEVVRASSVHTVPLGCECAGKDGDAPAGCCLRVKAPVWAWKPGGLSEIGSADWLALVLACSQPGPVGETEEGAWRTPEASGPWESPSENWVERA